MSFTVFPVNFSYLTPSPEADFCRISRKPFKQFSPNLCYLLGNCCFCLFNPIKPGLSVVCRAYGGGGGLRGQDAKNQGYHQLIEIKICIYFWRHDITNFPFEEGNQSSNSGIYLRKMVSALETSFYVQNRSSRPKN